MSRPILTFSKRLALAILCLLGFLCATALHAEEQPKQEAETMAKSKLQQRIDFGNAHILGQSIKSGAVYLMHRKKSDIQNMLEVRQHYRQEIKEDYGLEKTAIAESPAEPGEKGSDKEKMMVSQHAVDLKVDPKQ